MMDTSAASHGSTGGPVTTEHAPAHVSDTGHGTMVSVSADHHPVEHERLEDWGWHADLRGPTRVAGWLTAGALLAMIIGNHEGHVEDLWLVALAALVIFMLIRSYIVGRSAWRR
jgi:hypothetical protein